MMLLPKIPRGRRVAATAAAVPLLAILTGVFPLVSSAFQGSSPIPWPPTYYPEGDLGPPGCYVDYRFRLPNDPDKPDFACFIKCDRADGTSFYPVTRAADRASAYGNCRKAGPDFDGGWLQEGDESREVCGEWERGHEVDNCSTEPTRCSIKTGPRQGIPLLRIWYPEGSETCSKMEADPHVTTFDGVRYDLQAAGEFVGIESLDDDLEVQVRLEPYGRHVSYVSAVAARVAGHRVTLAPRTDAPLRVDGQVTEIPDGSLVYLTDERNAVLIRTGDRYTIVWPDSSNLHVDVHGFFQDAYFLPAPDRDGRLIGLFGDADGEGTDDFQTREMRLLDSPPGFDTLYRIFADSWRVRPGESLFDYAPGESTETFTDRSVPEAPATVDALSPADRARAEAACRDAGVTEAVLLEQCVVDVGFSGDEAFIDSALAHQTPPMFAHTAAGSFPEPIVSGLCRPEPAATPAAASRADAARTGRFEPGPADFRGEPAWSAHGFRPNHEPLVADERVLAARDDTLVALDLAAGTELWVASGPGGRIARRGLLAAGGAVFAAWDDALTASALDSGTECWRLPIAGATSPAYADGRLYVSVDEGQTGYVAAIEASSGLFVWRYDTRNPAPANWPSPTAPTVGGEVVFVADGREVVALDRASGRLRWRADIGTSVTEGLAYFDGVVYAPDRRDGLQALDAASGATRWTFAEPGMSLGTAVAVDDERVYLADQHHLHALERTSGTEVWRIDADRDARLGDPVAAGARLYAITGAGELVVLDAATGAEMHRTGDLTGSLRFGWSVPTPAQKGLFFILPDGTLNAYR